MGLDLLALHHPLGACSVATITPEILERYEIARLADVKPATVNHELGHVDPGMSAKYGHLSQAALVDAVKLLDGAVGAAGYSVATRPWKR
ncbi:MAG: hypothetical protein HY725_01745 [Candidatus Rokubacteria bacterium]|nr:hypothetical protein [Candidatus Rokubacteria bacterium]